MPDNIDDNPKYDDPEGRGSDERNDPRRTDTPDPANEYENVDWTQRVDRTYDSAYLRQVTHDDEQEERGGEMGFFEHLEELRWRILKSVIAVAATSAVCGYFYQELIQDVLFGPAKRLHPPLKIINTEVAGQITLAIQVVLFSGLILAVPFIIWQLWAFIKPGLYPKERKYVSAIAIATIFCFMAGVVFSYFVMIPNSIGFLAGFTFEGIENNITAANYLSFVLGLILASGVVFEMPMISYALARFGILTPPFMRHYRRHAIVVILIVAAIVTPTPDPFNQLLLAVPLYALYEISILVAAMATRQRAEALVEYAEEESRN
jgi:sec-independent protein translocase protein TatC